MVIQLCILFKREKRRTYILLLLYILLNNVPTPFCYLILDHYPRLEIIPILDEEEKI